MENYIIKVVNIIKVIRIEKHIIRKNHPMWNDCDLLCFQAKNMYNLCNYTIRQEFINSKNVLKYGDLNKQLKDTDAFKELGSNSAQMVTKMLCKSWKSFLVAVKDYSCNPNKYLGKPRIPSYKDKNGRYTCTLTNMQSQIFDGYLYFAFKRLHEYSGIFKTNIKGHHLSTRIVPQGNCYVLEVVYEKEIEQLELNQDNIASIDLGVNNFVTMVNNIGKQPIVINGRGIKSYNQYWNKGIAKYRSIAKKTNGLDWTKRLQQLTDKRQHKLDYFMHCTSKYIVDYCVKNDIGTLIMGKNINWKQECRLIKVANQNFVYIPYESFINKVSYKCEEVGINLILTEESYTSGTSFIDGELPCKENYDKSRRIHRGLFKCYNGMSINADVNGAYQIMRKVFSNALGNEIVGVHLHPVVINI
jgi:putative transposase